MSTEATPQATRQAALLAAPLATPASAGIAGNRHRGRLSGTVILPSSPRHQWVSP
jgi:hypothetical protein